MDDRGREPLSGWEVALVLGLYAGSALLSLVCLALLCEWVW